MDCERFDKTSMDLLYGELDELSQAATLRHLHHCTRCREIWGHLRTTRELSQIPQEDPPVELFARIMQAETIAHQSLPIGERFSRTVSVLAGYAMRPQLAMAALLVLMVGSGLIFVRAQPQGGHSEQMRVVERGVPAAEQPDKKGSGQALVFGGEPDPIALERDELKDTDSPALTLNSPKDVKVRNGERQRAAYGDAMAAYQQGRYAEAERLFSEVASAGGEQSASAALHEGHAARNGSGCQRAARIYDSVAERWAGGIIAKEASWHAASCYRAMGQTARAIANYQSLAVEGAFAERAKLALAELAPSASPQTNSVEGEATAETSHAAAPAASTAAAKSAGASAPPSASTPPPTVAPAEAKTEAKTTSAE